MDLPVNPPIAPMLSKVQEEIPSGDGWLYEPKWDGFRAIAFRDGDELHISSRDEKPLERYFPELVPALKGALPERCVVDGEVVVTRGGELDFDSLQLRIHPARSRIEKLSVEIPASFIAFDLLALGNDDLMSEPMTARRKRLEDVLPPPSATIPGQRTEVMLTPQTDDSEVAQRWFQDFEAFGLDGLIAKRHDLTYRPGERSMIKIKHRRTADCVVGGYRLSKTGDGIGSLLLGLYDGPVLQYVGHTSSFKAPVRRALLAQLKELEGHESFGGGRSPGGPSRWVGAQAATWVPVKPVLVCEVAYDKMQQERFRHASTFLRWRDDKKPTECTFDQLSKPPER